MQLVERYFIKNIQNGSYWDFEGRMWQPLGICEPFQSSIEANKYLSDNLDKVFATASFVTIETIYYPI